MTRLLHIHAQGAWHDEAYIVGNREALEALRNAITDVLNRHGSRMAPAENAIEQVEAMTSDGEGYSVVVICDNSPWQSPTWKRAALPYTAESARSPMDALWPRDR